MTCSRYPIYYPVQGLPVILMTCSFMPSIFMTCSRHPNSSDGLLLVCLLFSWPALGISYSHDLHQISKLFSWPVPGLLVTLMTCSMALNCFHDLLQVSQLFSWPVSQPTQQVRGVAPPLSSPLSPPPSSLFCILYIKALYLRHNYNYS